MCFLCHDHEGHSHQPIKDYIHDQGYVNQSDGGDGGQVAPPGGVNASAQVGINALDSGQSWDTTTVSYTFSYTMGNNGNQGASNYAQMNAAQQATAIDVMNYFEEVINIDFVDTATNGTNAGYYGNSSTGYDIAFNQANLPSGIAGWANYPNEGWGADVTIDYVYDGTSSAGHLSLARGSFGWHLMAHELGHAMGLQHPNDAPQDSGFSVDTTIMSYNSGVTASRSGPSAPQGLQIYDIAALQSIYGANTNYNSGDTTYSFDGSYFVKTLWDGNGNDTINASAYSGNSTIDLREGTDNITSIGNTKLWMAYGINMENATGGSGADTITGNGLANVLDGNAGADILTGGAGADVFDFNSRSDSNSSATDTITDFQQGVDKIAVAGLNLDGVSNSGSGNTLIYTDMGSYTQLSTADGSFRVNVTGDITFNASDFTGFNTNTPGDVINGTQSSGLAGRRITSDNLGDFEIMDYDGDGQLDIVTTGGVNGGSLVWYNGASGEKTTILDSNIGDYRVVDFDGDGNTDVVTTANGGLVWIEQDGTENRITYHTVSDYEIADMNGDGNLDVVSNDGSYQNGVSIVGAVWYSAEGTINRITYNDLGDWQLADIDADGTAEVVSNNGTYQNGSTFAGIVSYEGTGQIGRLSYVADSEFKLANLDGDSALEVVTNYGNWTSGAATQGLLTANNGALTRVTSNNLGDYDVGDFDGDGQIEYITTNGAYGSGVQIDGIMMYEANGSLSRLTNSDVSTIEISDWDNDGDADLLVTGGNYGNGLVQLHYGGANDVLTGTVNNDTITGGEGSDTLTGDAGADVFVFGNDFDIDTITDFELGVDTIEFANTFGISTAQDALDKVLYTGGNAVIGVGGEGVITLNGISSGLTVDDFSIG